MSYQCLQCGAKIKVTSTSGACTACGSHQLRSTGNVKEANKKSEKPSKTAAELLVMFLLWGLFLYGVWDQYLS